MQFNSHIANLRLALTIIHLDLLALKRYYTSRPYYHISLIVYASHRYLEPTARCRPHNPKLRQTRDQYNTRRQHLTTPIIGHQSKHKTKLGLRCPLLHSIGCTEIFRVYTIPENTHLLPSTQIKQHSDNMNWHITIHKQFI